MWRQQPNSNLISNQIIELTKLQRFGVHRGIADGQVDRIVALGSARDSHRRSHRRPADPARHRRSSSRPERRRSPSAHLLVGRHQIPLQKVKK